MSFTTNSKSGEFRKPKYILRKMFDQVIGVIKEPEDHNQFKAPESVMNSDVFIAGGACRAAFAGEQISDLDIYFKNGESFTKFKAKIEEYYKPLFTSDNAISYETDNKLKFQLIKKIFDYPENVMAQFDFTICMCSYTPALDLIQMHDNFMEHVAGRMLVFNPDAKYPINSLFRAHKFIKKGYKISAIEWIKLGLKCNQLNLLNYAVLKEQLEGIDTVFLKNFTDNLKDKAEKEYDFNEFMGMMDEYLNDKFGIEE